MNTKKSRLKTTYITFIKNKFVRFCIVGAANTMINYFIFFALLTAGSVNYLTAGSLGFISGAFSGFFLNRSWTFQSSRLIKTGLPLYFSVQLLTLFCNFVTQYFSVHVIMVDKMYSQVYAIVVTTIINFILSKKFVFPT